MLGFDAISLRPISGYQSQFLVPTAITSGESFGTIATGIGLLPIGIVSEEVFGLQIFSKSPLVTETWIVRFR